MALPRRPDPGEGDPSASMPAITAATFPRVRAENQPPNQRATFSEFYPNGLPIVYKMLQTPGVDGVPQTYVENHLPVGFYTSPPPDARAVFSTSDGTRSFRHLDHLLPQRRIHLWNGHEIQSICNSIRRVFWKNMRDMRQPSCWDDMWNHFDAQDLYHYGVLNLWNIINHLVDENRIIYEDVAKERAIHIGRWADDWASRPDNKRILTDWDASQGPLLQFLSPQDWKELGDIQDEVAPLIANALKCRRRLLLAPSSSPRPKDLMTSCQDNNLENWLGMLNITLSNWGHISTNTNLLATQSASTSNGLPPSPPETRSHPCSPATRNAPAPVFVYDGKHYFLPDFGTPADQQQARTPSDAVEALQMSAAAAAATGRQNTSGHSLPTIVNGSGRNLSIPPKVLDSGVHHQNMSHSSVGIVGNENQSVPLKRSPSLAGTVQDKHVGDDNEIPRNAVNDDGVSHTAKLTTTVSLPPSAVMGHSRLATSPEQAVATQEHAGQVPLPPSHPSSSSLDAA